MQSDLIAAMHLRCGVITRAEALRLVGRAVLDNAVRQRLLVRVLPSVYVTAEFATDEEHLMRAALAYVPGGGLSHTTGLTAWRVAHVALAERLHVTTDSSTQAKPGPTLVVHRRSDFDLTQTVQRRELRVVRLERAVVESWPLLVPSERRAPAIAAVRDRRTTADRLISTLAEMPRVSGHAEMAKLFELLALGCQSELELWGHEAVFSHSSLPRARLQYVVLTEAGRYVLDRAYDKEMVGVELDGAAWHGSAAQRERDVRRDAALAAAGWLIVRFTHRRLTADPAGCREELRQILTARRHQLRAG